MATTQFQLQSGTWTDTFPENQVTELQSTVFVKKLLAIAVSNIAYMRVIFPDGAFGDRRLEDLDLKILKNDKSCPSAAKMVDWLKGAFDALEKKYLRMLILGVYRSTGDPSKLLEMYTFTFKYTDTTQMEVYSNDKKISSASSASQTKKATVSLLRNLMVLIQTLKPLPYDVRVTMKLLYYDDVTPEDYEPPGFKAAKTDSFYMEGNPMKYRFHKVSTSHHSMQLRVVADTGDTATAVEDDVEQEMSVAGLEGLDMEVHIGNGSQSQQEPVVDSTTPQTNTERCSQPSVAMDEDLVDAGDAEPVPVGVRCACKANDDDGLMILCAVCHYWQHAICFKVLDQSSVPARHICNLCCSSVDASFHPTDPDLDGVPDAEVQLMCLWRRSLAAVLKFTMVSSAQLASRLGVTDAVASQLFERLLSEGFLSSKTKRSTAASKCVQKRKIKRDALPKYFTRNTATAMDFD